MAIKVWYKHIKVGDTVLAKLDKTHIWHTHIGDNIEVKITDVHEGWLYGEFIDKEDPSISRIIILDYSDILESGKHKASIIKKLT